MANNKQKLECVLNFIVSIKNKSAIKHQPKRINNSKWFKPKEKDV